MKFFKKDTLTHGLVGGAIGGVVVGGLTLMSGGLVLAPAAAAAAIGTSIGALHGAGDEGGMCRKIIPNIAVSVIARGIAGQFGYNNTLQSTNNNNTPQGTNNNNLS